MNIWTDTVPDCTHYDREVCIYPCHPSLAMAMRLPVTVTVWCPACIDAEADEWAAGR